MLFSLSDTSPKVVVWCTLDQMNLARRAAELSGLTIIAAGSPETGQTGSLAGALGCKPCDDLRAAMVESVCDAFVMLAVGEFGMGDSATADTRALDAAHARGVKILSLEPVVADLADWTALGADAPSSIATIVRPLGMVRRARRYRELEEILRDFGPVHSLSLSLAGPRTEGSLAARLLSALDCASAIIGEPIAVAGALSARSMRSENRLRSLSGDCAASLRTATGQVGSLMLCDRIARHDLHLTLHGDGGVIRYQTDSLLWLGKDGVPVETSSFGPQSAVTGARLLADELSRQLYPGAAEHGPVRWASVLAAAQAVLLSAATGQVESPETIRRMNGLAG